VSGGYGPRGGFVGQSLNQNKKKKQKNKTKKKKRTPAQNQKKIPRAGGGE